MVSPLVWLPTFPPSRIFSSRPRTQTPAPNTAHCLAHIQLLPPPKGMLFPQRKKVEVVSPRSPWPLSDLHCSTLFLLLGDSAQMAALAPITVVHQPLGHSSLTEDFLPPPPNSRHGPGSPGHPNRHPKQCPDLSDLRHPCHQWPLLCFKSAFITCHHQTRHCFQYQESEHSFSSYDPLSSGSLAGTPHARRLFACTHIIGSRPPFHGLLGYLRPRASSLAHMLRRAIAVPTHSPLPAPQLLCPWPS